LSKTQQEATSIKTLPLFKSSLEDEMMQEIILKYFEEVNLTYLDTHGKQFSFNETDGVHVRKSLNCSKEFLIGYAHIGIDRLQCIAGELSATFNAKTYNKFTCNSLHFCDEFCYRILSKHIPPNIWSQISFYTKNTENKLSTANLNIPILPIPSSVTYNSNKASRMKRTLSNFVKKAPSLSSLYKTQWRSFDSFFNKFISLSNPEKTLLPSNSENSNLLLYRL